MLILAVETATSQHSIAVLRESQVLGVRNGDSQGSHTRWLIPTIDELLGSLDLKLENFSGLAVSIGPGSFTGLRAGLATMTGFRLALDLPLVTVPTLEAMAWNFRSEEKLICPMLRARAREVYWACFRWKFGELVRVTDDRVGSIENLVQSLDEPAWGLGEGWHLYQQYFLDKSDKLKSAPFDTHAASAVSVGLSSIQRLTNGEIAEMGVSPRYVLPSYAELKDHQKKV